MTDTQSSEEPFATEVTVDAGDRSDWSVSPRIFGAYVEHYGREIYPGIYAEHLTNNSFEPWCFERKTAERSRLAYDEDEIPEHEGIAYPWQPVGDATFETPEGGVHGGDRSRFQRMTVDGDAGGVSQRVPLPDYRTAEYDLSVSVRGEGVEAVEARLTDLDGEVLAAVEIPVTDEWVRHEDLRLELAGESDVRYPAEGADGGFRDNSAPHGEYRFEFVAEGEGGVDLDWATLLSGDAVDGKFNPEMLERMEELAVESIKWPGGNFASHYRWRDGVGPLEDRPVSEAPGWSGLEPNFLGTAEFVDLCERIGVEPMITVGWWAEIGPEEAADWVEYCNGDPDETEMGALRAEHGYEEPFDVRYWEIGNEVWGPWQFGHTADPWEFAGGSDERAGVDAYYDAMTAVDPDITVFADLLDPGYTRFEADADEWAEALFAEVGDRIDGVDTHHYNFGIRRSDEDSPEEWVEDHDADPIDYMETLVAYPTQYERELADLAADAAAHGVDPFVINVGEWGLYPHLGEDWPDIGMGTTASAAYTAGMFGAFVRQGDAVRRASHTHMPVKQFPDTGGSNATPLDPVAQVQRLYAEVLADGRDWHALGVEVDGPARTLPELGTRVERMEGVPYVDATAVVDDAGEELAVFLANRNLSEGATVTVDLGPDAADRSVAVDTLEPTDSPHDQQESRSEPDAYRIDRSTETVSDDGTVAVELAPSAVARLRID
ncbi:alpha-L-arabinofuranosidase [Halosimplex pelagicum]|uniref:non-reducing end alpha-L-arabinofuranosidase n=1 Tax=Halosimplex pelagicum TaxID=869886 RepID=A0A7D5PCJ5_9EURY|nr:alpha-L-arabinofuranosidase [Halosimplex pelagicum]QLH83242.1 alpha-L-arabinofuranosidase [Halosimplex pelagicum]